MINTTVNLEKEQLLKFYHEIRTPLNIILGFNQVLSNDKLITKCERQLYLEIIQETTDKLLIDIDSIMESCLQSNYNK